MKRTLPAVLGILLLSTRLAALASPNFISVGAMTSPRQEHTATLLTNGKVLVAAGSLNNNYTSLSGADLFNPANGLWRNTGLLNTSRMRQTATLLPNGKVLVTGGDNIPAGGGPVSSAELYDPATETWTNTGSLNIGRELHTATLLSNGKVLVVGGHGSDNLASAELYDPATGTWTNTGSLNAARFHHTATLLPNGKVLVTGGTIYNGGFNTALSSAELYDPATERWTFTYPMSTNRSGHTATLLPSGKVLVAGGSDWNNSFSSAELYDPATELWTPTGSLNATNGYETATLLANGKVLVAGGGDSSSAELYDPTNGTWMQIGTMNADRGYGVTATLLANGRVLFVGGLGTNDTLSSAELFDSTIAIVTLGNLNQIYDGTAKSVSVTTVPAGLTVNLTYSGSANAPTNVGNYTVIGTVNDAYYAGSATNTLAINNKTTATVTLGNLSQTCDGTAKTVSVTTDPPGLTVDLTYNGSADVPINAGSYTVIGTINDATWAGSATNMLVIHNIADFFTYLTNNSAITITGYTGLGGNVIIPSIINGLPVTIIGKSAFSNCYGLTGVVIPTSVISIDDEAFNQCYSLNNVIIPNSVVSIGKAAFDGCLSLTNITISASVTSVGDSAFINCTSLTGIMLPSSITNIGRWAFAATSISRIDVDAANANYSSVNGVVFNKDQTTIVIFPSGRSGSYAIPTTVTNIGEEAFYFCTSLTGVTIPSSVTSIGSGAFQYCYDLTSIAIPSSITSIADGAFGYCTNLTSVVIPASVTSIGNFAFGDCTSLVHITIPGNITNIGWSAFYNCINLTGVYFSGNAPSVGSGVFDGDNYATVYYLAQTTSWGATLGGRPTALWPAPALGISTYNSQPTVFFPTATGTNFVLQMTTNLASGNWVTISNGIPISGIIVTNPPGTAFFRLH